MDALHIVGQDRLHSLLAHLSGADRLGGEWDWAGWHIRAIGGGLNNRLFRAALEETALAVKFTRQDGRDRAGREWNTLHVLREAGLAIAPTPLLLERERYAHPVVVQSWETGTVADSPPTQDAAWDALLDHLRTVHSLTPERVHRALPRTVLTMKDADEALDAIHSQCALLPAAGWRGDLRELVQRAEAIAWPVWPPVTLTLCRADPNIRNFLQRPGPWKSVDWEYSGWCDPAFEIADLIVHPSYAAVSEERWEWVIRRYCGPDTGEVEQRIRVYRTLMLVWWSVRMARYLCEAGAEADLLAPRPAGWREEKEEQFQDYSQRAGRALAEWG